MNTIQTCFVPELYEHYHNPDAVVIVVDILRATTSICTAFMNGVNKIIPVSTIPEAMAYKEKGYLVAAERNGIKRDFADFGNSPFNFSPENIRNKDVVYTTTNGTRTIHTGARGKQVAIGAFTNIQAVAEWIKGEGRDVLILCAGWKGRFNLEDTLFAGALSKLLMDRFPETFSTNCDSTKGALDLWNVANENLSEYIKKVAQYTRLNSQGVGESIDYCFTLNLTDLVPVFKNGELIVGNR